MCECIRRSHLVVKISLLRTCTQPTVERTKWMESRRAHRHPINSMETEEWNSLRRTLLVCLNAGMVNSNLMKFTPNENGWCEDECIEITQNKRFRISCIFNRDEFGDKSKAQYSPPHDARLPFYSQHKQKKTNFFYLRWKPDIDYPIRFSCSIAEIWNICPTATVQKAKSAKNSRVEIIFQAESRWNLHFFPSTCQRIHTQKFIIIIIIIKLHSREVYGTHALQVGIM